MASADADGSRQTTRRTSRLPMDRIGSARFQSQSNDFQCEGALMPRNAAYLVSDPSRLPEGLLSSTSVPPTEAFGTSSEHELRPFMHSHNRTEKPEKAVVEILNSNELALRLKVKESWVIEQSKRSRTADPIPVLRLGKHRRFRWGSPEMNDWLARRAGGTTTSRKTWS